MRQGTFFLLLWTGHLLGDFYCQSKRMALGIRQPGLFRASWHPAAYALMMILVLAPVIPPDNRLGAAVLLLLISWMHIGVEKGRYGLQRRMAKLRATKTPAEEGLWRELGVWCDRYAFFVEQAIHLVVLLVISYPASARFAPNALGRWLLAWEAGLPAGLPVRPLVLFVALLSLAKPTGVAVGEFLRVGDAQNGQQKAGGFQNGGMIIGVLERLLIFLLVMVGQYGVIAVVFAAKAFARYEMITAQRASAEYFLIGTLLSMLFVSAMALLVQLYFVR